MHRRVRLHSICLENVIFMGYISIYIPNVSIAIQMVAMATRKIHYAPFHGSNDLKICLCFFRLLRSRISTPRLTLDTQTMVLLPHQPTRPLSLVKSPQHLQPWPCLHRPPRVQPSPLTPQRVPCHTLPPVPLPPQVTQCLAVPRLLTHPLLRAQCQQSKP